MRNSILILTGLLALATAWSKEDHEIFRLKDELERHEGAGITFYDYLSITPSANQDDINKAYRKKAKLLHPDKAKASFLASRATAASASYKSASKSASSKSGKAPKPTTHVTKPPKQKELQKATKAATDRFTRLGLITNVLRGSGRARYDHFLQNGFPAWRGADYYYARFRPGLWSVLTGLFVFTTGFVHYAILVLGAKRQRDFVERYIKQARVLAWGDASPVANIPGIDTAGTPAAAEGTDGEADEAPGAPMNRRERRMQEKEAKKPGAASRRAIAEKEKLKRSRSGTSTPAEPETEAEPEGPVPGPRKRVLAENGKVLVVDSDGNVFLEQEDEDGKKGLFLLDPDEVQSATFGQTVLFKLPVWAFKKVRSLATGSVDEDQAGLLDVVTGQDEGEEVDGFVKVGGKRESAGAARKRKGQTRK